MADVAESSDVSSQKCDDPPAASPEVEEEMLKKKYGGVLPKKPPLIGKEWKVLTRKIEANGKKASCSYGQDHERAFFDSADWALGKQGAPPGHKPRSSSIESLRPKLQPTPHQTIPSRRSSFIPTEAEAVSNESSPR